MTTDDFASVQDDDEMDGNESMDDDGMDGNESMDDDGMSDDEMEDDDELLPVSTGVTAGIALLVIGGLGVVAVRFR